MTAPVALEPAPAVHDGGYFGGTFRAVSPERTWERVRPHLARAGITRVADVTGLDDIGVPVWQAVRPNSRNITVSQGKGVSPVLAKVSAVMESFELHCAEDTVLPTRRASFAEMAEAAGDAAGLPLLAHHALTPALVTDWCEVDDLVGGRRMWWPKDAVTVNYEVLNRWRPPLVRVNSNGVAGGNTLDEATLHALLELIERHSLARARAVGLPWHEARSPLPGSAGPAAEVCGRILDAGAVLQCLDVTSPALGVPTFVARVWSPSLPRWFSGSGSHLDAEVALSRALTEAVQSRVTAIAGARDDIAAARYDFARAAPGLPAAPACRTDDLVTDHDGRLSPGRGISGALDTLLERCAADGTPVVRADLTLPRYGIPVVRVAAPGLDFAERHGHG